MAVGPTRGMSVGGSRMTVGGRAVARQDGIRVGPRQGELRRSSRGMGLIL